MFIKVDVNQCVLSVILQSRVMDTVGVCFRKHGFPLNSGKTNTSASVFGSEGFEFNIELALHTKHHQEINLVLLMRSTLNSKKVVKIHHYPG